VSATGASPSDATALPGPDRPRPVRWYRRRAILVAAGTIIVVAVTVITDLPVHSSNASDISAERSVMSEVNTDMTPCTYAAKESFSINADQLAGRLTASDRRQAPGLLRDDLSACSFTDNSIFDLADVEPPSSAAGKRLGELVNTVTLWATSDALGAISDLEVLLDNPNDVGPERDLLKRERALSSDRAAARADVSAADHILGTRLSEPNLPVLPDEKPSTG